MALDYPYLNLSDMLSSSGISAPCSGECDQLSCISTS
jgi:hypothetical protein